MFFLAKRGYEIVGADFSPDLLKIARGKAKKENLSLKFIDGFKTLEQFGIDGSQFLAKKSAGILMVAQKIS